MTFLDRTNEIILKYINKKFNLDIKDLVGDKNCDLIKKNLGNDVYRELKELILYYQNKLNKKFLDLNFHRGVSELMKKDICVAVKQEEEIGTGFFCKIPFPPKEKTVFITCDFIANINYHNQSPIYLKFERMNKIITLNLNDRYKYTNQKYNTTIIEIKENDSIQSYLELDDILIYDIIDNVNNNQEYENKMVYILQKIEGELSLSYGAITGISPNKYCEYEFFHNCWTNGESGGSPILNINNKIIGIHWGHGRNFKIKKGTFLNYPVKEFIHQYCSSKIKNKNIESKQLNKTDNLIQKFKLIHKSVGIDIFKDLEKLDINILYCRECQIINFFRLDFNEKVIYQMIHKALFNIEIENQKCTAFSCRIPIGTKNKYLQVLITSNKIINENILNKKNEIIEIHLEENKLIMRLSLDNRLKYTSSIYGITIIEIKYEDYIENFLDLDVHILNCLINDDKNLENDYANEAIYMILYSKENVLISYGVIKNIFVDKNYQFMHYCFGTEDSSDLPILNKFNQVIGIHCGNRHNYGVGTFLAYPIKEFIQKCFKD